MLSYGVVASKPAQVQVRWLTPTDRRSVAPADRPEVSPWGSGRLTLTSLHLTFVPTSASLGVPALTVPLDDVHHVEMGHGRARKTITVTTRDLELHVRVTAPAAFAKRVSTSVEARRRRSAIVTEQPAPDRSLPSEL